MSRLPNRLGRPRGAAPTASLVSALRRRLAMGSLFLHHPAEFRDRLSKDLELLLDKLRTPPAYDPIAWSAVQLEVRARYPDAPKILGEAPLQMIESDVLQRLEARARNGPWALVYNCDLSLARCVYLFCRLLKPVTVIETGVAYGLSSAFILQALEINGQGTLHSIDLAPLGGDASQTIGALVPDRLKARWELLRGTSRRLLPSLLQHRSVDVFLHDSLHTYRTMRWEFDQVWPHLRKGGALLADDVQGNRAFAELLNRDAAYWRVVREEAKPFLFGIAVR